MDQQTFIQKLNLTGIQAIQVQDRFESLAADWKEGVLPFFLEEEYFKKLYPFLKVENPLEEILCQVRELLDIVREHEEISLLAHILCKSSFEEKKVLSFQFPDGMIPFLGKRYSGLFAVMVSMGIYPYLRKEHAKLSLPEKYAQDILAWIGGTTLAYEQAYPGIFGRRLDFSWLIHYVNNTLFRIGRLEYLMHSAPEWLCAIYTNDRGDLKVLCGNDWAFRADKRRADAGEEAVYRSYLHETEDTITGISCDPYGVVDFDHPVTLDKKEYRSILSPWDLCPSIHIPAGGKMPFGEVLSSMKEAVQFFQKYFHRHVPVICCCSWILNPAWETLFKNSNMVRFRQECYAGPGLSWGPRAGMGFIFGRGDISPEELPAKNSVQKVYQEAYRKGLIGTGAIFVLTSDLDKLGKMYYREKYSITSSSSSSSSSAAGTRQE